MVNSAQAVEEIPGFDQTETDYDRTKEWKPFSDRKVRVGIVGHGVCKFGLAFDLQNHPNVELVAVSDLFPDRCQALAKVCKCGKTYPSLEEMVKDGGRIVRPSDGKEVKSVAFVQCAGSRDEHRVAAADQP